MIGVILSGRTINIKKKYLFDKNPKLPTHPSGYSKKKKGRYIVQNKI